MILTVLALWFLLIGVLIFRVAFRRRELPS